MDNVHVNDDFSLAKSERGRRVTFSGPGSRRKSCCVCLSSCRGCSRRWPSWSASPARGRNIPRTRTCWGGNGRTLPRSLASVVFFISRRIGRVSHTWRRPGSSRACAASGTPPGGWISPPTYRSNRNAAKLLSPQTGHGWDTSDRLTV